MARFIPRSDGEKQRRIIVENLLIREHFPFFTTRMVGNRLVCRGRVKPTDSSAVYRVEVVYQPWSSPAVRILEPAIDPETKLHFYHNGTLCLYDWREQPWQKGWHLTDTVIPWTAEWLLFYEIYLLTGKWIGASAVHTNGKAAEPNLAAGQGDVDSEQQERTE